MPKTLELMQLALDLAFTVVQRFKHALAVPRPHEIDPGVSPALLTPGHGSLPSGHATEAFTVATLMTAFLGNDQATGKLLRRLAQRIADNREVAGLHYAIDSLAGQVLGQVLGAFVAARCGAGKVSSGTFDGSNLTGDEECMESGEPSNIAAVQSGADISVESSPQLEWLWNQARLEWGAPLPAEPAK
ncbi:phosphatase PAP2 family protein [Piscinibacter sakaiensis]|uniref:phosphatase PAP2 family protein n=1 Tax=Piscinibacter sakaiensis TaxID=1547922 RepID=UPI003AACCE63